MSESIENIFTLCFSFWELDVDVSIHPGIEIIFKISQLYWYPNITRLLAMFVNKQWTRCLLECLLIKAINGTDVGY